MRSRWLLLLAAAAGAATFGGCLRAQPVYEETYRLFYAKENFQNFDIEAYPDEVGRRFADTAAVNREIDDLARRGFALYEIEPLPGLEAPTLLRFRRRWPYNRLPTNAPMEYMGVYGVENGGAPVFYAFTPWRRGYEIHEVGREGLSRSMPAVWDGHKLRWKEGSLEHAFELAGDGETIKHTVRDTDLEKMPVPVESREARRITRAN